MCEQTRPDSGNCLYPSEFVVWLQPRVAQPAGIHRSCDEAPGNHGRAPAVRHGHQNHVSRTAHWRNPASGQSQPGQGSGPIQNHKFKSEWGGMNMLKSPVQVQVHPVREEQSFSSPPEGDTVTPSSCGRWLFMHEWRESFRFYQIFILLCWLWAITTCSGSTDHIYNQSPYQLL